MVSLIESLLHVIFYLFFENGSVCELSLKYNFFSVGIDHFKNGAYRFKIRITMAGQIPNPIRLFSSLRDDFFIHILESFEIPMNLFSDIRDSQLPQLMYIVESSRIKEKRAGNATGGSVFDGLSLTAFLPRFIVFDGLVKLLSEENLKVIQSKFKSSTHRELLEKSFQNAKDWLNDIPESELDEKYIELVEFLFEVFLGPITGEDLPEKILEKLDELDSSFKKMFSDYIDYQFYYSLKNDKLLTGNYGERLVPLNEPSEGEKPKTRPITKSQLRGIVNFLFSLFLELSKFLENPKLPKQDTQDTESTEEDTENNKETETPKEGSKDDEETGASEETDADGKSTIELNEETKKALEHMVEAMVLDMLLYQPYPDKQRYPVVSYYLRSLSSSLTDIPEELWELFIAIYKIFSHGIVIGSVPYRSIESDYKRHATRLWNKLLPRIEEDLTKNIIAAHWIQVLVTKSILDQLTNNPKEIEPLRNTLSRLENAFWNQGRKLFAKSPSDAFSLWSYVAYLSTVEIRNTKTALLLYEQLEPIVKICEEDGDQFDVEKIDLLSLYKRLITFGIQTKTLSVQEKMFVVIEKYESLVSQLKEEEHEDAAIEERLVASFKDAVKNMEIEEEAIDEAPRHIRRRRKRR